MEKLYTDETIKNIQKKFTEVALVQCELVQILQYDKIDSRIDNLVFWDLVKKKDDLRSEIQQLFKYDSINKLRKENKMKRRIEQLKLRIKRIEENLYKSRNY